MFSKDHATTFLGWLMFARGSRDFETGLCCGKGSLRGLEIAQHHLRNLPSSNAIRSVVKSILIILNILAQPVFVRAFGMLLSDLCCRNVGEWALIRFY